MSQPTAIFVYGTLQRGEVRAGCWPYPPVRVQTAWTCGRLFDLGPYPAMIHGEHRVNGELWYIAKEHLATTLEALDRIECYGIDDVDLYVREVVPCLDDDGRCLEGHAYFLADESGLDPVQEIQPDAQGIVRWPVRS